jgi:uncharacterized protein YhaN
MRFSIFSIEKYGAFERRDIHFSEEHGLSVVFGPNEAGKSTLLSGVSDFLFGIPTQSPLGTFGYDAMRLGATMQLAGGASLSLQRRKGRGVTLSDDVGAGVDDAVLARVLGATGRDRFETLFGLNHDTLRAGGNRLLAADGEIGRLIVEAGGGLRTLVDKVSALNGQIDGLFAPRRSADRAFYKASDALEAADRAVRTGQVTREAYEQAEANSRAAQETYDRLRTESREVTQRMSGLERMIRVVPVLRDLAREEERLEAFADLPVLPDEFEALAKEAVIRRDAAAKTFEVAKRVYDDLKSRRDALPVEARWAGFEGPIEGIIEAAVHVRKGRQDRPNRLQDLRESEGRLANLRRLIGLTSDDAIEDRLPTPERLDMVQQLHASGLERRPALAAKRERVRELESDVIVLKERLDLAKKMGKIVPFGALAGEFAVLPTAAAALSARKNQNDAAQSAVVEKAKALEFSSLAALRKLDAPDAEVVQAQIDLITMLQTAHEREGERVRDAQADMDGAQREIDRLHQSGEVPTEAAIKHARTDRETALAPLRSAYLSGRTEGSPEQRGEGVVALDRAVEHADFLTDRRSAEAQRVAALEQQERRRSEAEAAREAAKAEGDRIALAIENRRSGFAALYPDALSKRPELLRLKKFVQERSALLQSLDALEKEAGEVERQAAELSPQLEALGNAETKAGLTPTSEATLASRVQAVVAAISAHEREHAEYGRDLREHGTASAELAKTRAELKVLEDEDKAWSLAWQAGLAEIGLEPEASFERANAVLREWATAAGELENLAQITRRLQRLTEDEEALAALVKQVADGMELVVPTDPLAAADQLKVQWDDHEQLRIKRASLDPEVDRAEEERRSADQERGEAEASLASLKGDAGAADAAALTSVAKRHSESRSITAETGRIRTTITAAGDGLSVDQLRDQWAERDLDSLIAEKEELETDHRRLDEEIKVAVEAMQNASRGLQAYESAQGIGVALAERESAAADMQSVVERWLELSLAKELIERAIAGVRNEQQDPLVRRAGELFALTTRGAFEGVATDVDEKNHPVVVGRRANGARVRVSELSDGTRDQLFLSFRLASLERYASAAEPLPFIADDILVHFDDERSAATLELLAAFGGSNQVLLFTHHRSVRDEAERLSKTMPVEVLDLTL